MGNQDLVREAAQPCNQPVKQLNTPPFENRLAEFFLPSIPISNRNFTYAFIPRDFLRGLFGVLNMDLPTRFMKPDVDDLDVNDTIPSDIDPSTISYLGGFLSALPHYLSLTCVLQ